MLESIQLLTNHSVYVATRDTGSRVRVLLDVAALQKLFIISKLGSERWVHGPRLLLPTNTTSSCLQLYPPT